MTLLELVVATNLKGEISIPSVLKNFEIENTEEFCRFSEMNYLKSIDFKDDLIKILDELLLETSTPINSFSLQFIKNRNGKLQLALSDRFVESL